MSRPMPPELFRALTEATREADELFESGKTGGGGTRHWLRDCFLPALEARGIAMYAISPAVSSAENNEGG